MKRSLFAFGVLSVGLASAMAVIACGSDGYNSIEEGRRGTAAAAASAAGGIINGPFVGTGCSCKGRTKDSGFPYQCVELAMRYVVSKGHARWWGDAKDLFGNAPRDATDIFWNKAGAPLPLPGDLLVWTSTRRGHVAIVTGYSTDTATRKSYVDVIEQNIPGTATGASRSSAGASGSARTSDRASFHRRRPPDGSASGRPTSVAPRRRRRGNRPRTGRRRCA